MSKKKKFKQLNLVEKWTQEQVDEYRKWINETLNARGYAPEVDFELRQAAELFLGRLLP